MTEVVFFNHGGSEVNSRDAWYRNACTLVFHFDGMSYAFMGKSQRLSLKSEADSQNRRGR